MNKEKIMELLADKKSYLEEQFGVKKIGLFGSYARGEADNTSDIDIYIEFDMDKLNIDRYFQLLETLENLLGKKIDIITRDGKETIRVPSVREQIEREIVYV